MKLNGKKIDDLLNEDNEEVLNNRLTKQIAEEAARHRDEANELQEKRRDNNEYSNNNKKRHGFRS